MSPCSFASLRGSLCEVSNILTVYMYVLIHDSAFFWLAMKFCRSFCRYTCTNPSSCKSTGLEEDPCSVQGERKCSGRFEIKSLDAAPTSSESDFDDEDDDDLTSMETLSESESESEDQILVQPTPRAKLIMHKPLRRLSSSCSESLTADDGALLREMSQTGVVESDVPPGRQNRAYSADMGRLQNANSSGVRASSRAADSNTMKKPSSNGFMSSAALEQRRYVSSLFQPASPLVGENMKVRQLVTSSDCSILTALIASLPHSKTDVHTSCF